MNATLLIALLALWITLSFTERWRSCPILFLWAGAQAIRSALWYTHNWSVVNALWIAFPFLQLCVVSEMIGGASIRAEGLKPLWISAWCGLVGAAVAMFSLSLRPEAYPLFPRWIWEIHTALHIGMLAALAASVAYSAIFYGWAGTIPRLAFLLYLGASAGADLSADPIHWMAATEAATGLQTLAIGILVVWAIRSGDAAGRSLPESPSGSSGPVDRPVHHGDA